MPDRLPVALLRGASWFEARPQYTRSVRLRCPVVAVLVAIDAGTSGVRAIAVQENGGIGGIAYRELRQHYPRPGWIEHDPTEIWRAVQATMAELFVRVDQPVAAVGITNQRETAVVWDDQDGQPLHRAIVWQDRRTAHRCEELLEAGALPFVRSRTGLMLDPYFSGTKFEWLLTQGGIEAGPHLRLGTVDSWVLWNLTGGTHGGVHATDPSNACRTLLYDIVDRGWSDELCALFHVPPRSLPEVCPSSSRIGLTEPDVAGDLPAGIPVSGIAGDQQAALFGQACFDPGMTKNTYGTGSFVLMNVGTECPAPAEGLLTTVAWQLGDATSDLTYALEGSIFVTGATIQWLRDELGLIENASEIEPLASSVDSSEGVFIVPAFTGLGSPWWDSHARGTIVGLTRGICRAHLARAAIDAMVHQTRDVVDSMTAVSGQPPAELRVDGGASVMDLLLQLQADQLQLRVARASTPETTAMGAIYLAGLAEGVWSSLEELSEVWSPESAFEPEISREDAQAKHAGWHAALHRSRSWARADLGGAG